MKTVIDLLSQETGFINVKLLGNLLNMHPKTVYRKAREGLLPSYRIGSAVLFDRAEIAHWLRTNRAFCVPR